VNISPSSDSHLHSSYQLREWQVHVQRNLLLKNDQPVVLEPKLMELLRCLIEHQGQVVSKTRLLDEVWSGRFVVDGVLKRGISKLRRALGDDAKEPLYIETVQRRGYRLACTAHPIADETPPSQIHKTTKCPFKGLSAFTLKDAHLFFGRQRLINDILNALEQQRTTGRAFVLLSGPSGCGKSSIAQAGVMKHLCAAESDIPASPYSVVRFGSANSSLRLILARAFLQQSAFASSNVTDIQLEQYLESDSENSIHDWLDSQLLPDQRLTLLIDQMEELFSNKINAVERDEIVSTIYTLSRGGRVDVIATLRNDMFHRFAAQGALASLRGPHGHIEISSPSMAEISQIIRKPAVLIVLR